MLQWLRIPTRCLRLAAAGSCSSYRACCILSQQAVTMCHQNRNTVKNSRHSSCQPDIFLLLILSVVCVKLMRRPNKIKNCIAKPAWLALVSTHPFLFQRCISPELGEKRGVSMFCALAGRQIASADRQQPDGEGSPSGALLP